MSPPSQRRLLLSQGKLSTPQLQSRLHSENPNDSAHRESCLYHLKWSIWKPKKDNTFYMLSVFITFFLQLDNWCEGEKNEIVQTTPLLDLFINEEVCFKCILPMKKIILQQKLFMLCGQLDSSLPPS